jgi:hypothetical protein
MGGCSIYWMDVVAFDGIDALSDGIKLGLPAAFLCSRATTQAYYGQGKYAVQ